MVLATIVAIDDIILQIFPRFRRSVPSACADDRGTVCSTAASYREFANRHRGKDSRIEQIAGGLREDHVFAQKSSPCAGGGPKHRMAGSSLSADPTTRVLKGQIRNSTSRVTGGGYLQHSSCLNIGGPNPSRAWE
jgi:hypothetical protein